MAEQTSVLRIEVDSSQAVQQMADYSRLIEETKKREDALKKAIKEQGDASGELAVELAKLKAERTAYNRGLQESAKAVQNNIKQQKAQEGSLKSLRAQLSNLTKEYDELSRAERTSAAGRDKAAEINRITAELKKGEEGTQRFYRNVGNYANSLGGLFGGIAQGAGQALNGFRTLGAGATGALGPVGVILEIVSGLLQVFKGLLNSSEESSQATAETFAKLKAGAVQALNFVQKLGKGLLDAFKTASGFVQKVVNGIAKLLGKEKEWAEAREERLALAKELTAQQKEENAITLEQRKINEQNADSELKIAKLRAEAADKANLTATERIRILREAGEEEKRMSERNYELAKREYELQKRKSDLAGNSAEENEALSQAYTKMIQAQTAYFNKSREITAQISEATAKVMADQAKLAAENKKAYEELLTDFGEFLEAEIKAQDEAINQINDDYLLAYKNREAEARLRGESDLALKVETKKAELDMLHQLEGESDEQFKARQLAKQQEYLDAKKALADAEVQIEVGKWQAIGSVMSSLSGLLEEFGEESKAAAIASKALALGEVAIKTGVAIAGGVAQASAAGPFPANLVAIATTVATVLANIATATKTIKSAKFSTGGYVSGEGTATSDSIPARLSNGESVNNARSTSMFAPIYSSLNQMGGGVPIVASQTASQVQGEEMLARAFAKGMSEANIRVGVDEITRVQNRVKVVENLGVL